MLCSPLSWLHRPRHVVGGLWLAVALVSAAFSLHGQQPSPAASAAPAAPAATPLPPGTPAVGFFVPHTVLWLGRTTVIPFRVAQPAGNDETPTASVADASMVEVLRAPAVLAGETTGFLRVRGTRVGKTRLTLHGDAVLDLEIKTDPAAASFLPIDAESGRPQIVSPVPDAFVWGQFAVGVEVFDGSVRAVASDLSKPGSANATAATGGVKVQLRLPGGRLIDPIGQTGPEIGPQRHYQFSVRAEDFPPGPLTLTAVATPDGISDVDRRSGRAGAVQESEPLALHVLRTQAGAYWAGECENPAIMGESKELLAPARPASIHLTPRVPEVGPNPEASGGKEVRCPGGNDAWGLPFMVRAPGEYQLLLQMRGDFAGGAYPTAVLFRDGSETPAASVRLAGPKFHRLPVGAPIHLDAGPQILTVCFRNDFSHGKEDRNLYLDRYELVRVGDSPVAAPPNATAAAPAAAGKSAPPPAPAVLTSPAPTGDLSSLAPTRVSVLYPAVGASVFGADAVVARVAGGTTRAAWVDLVIDGQPQGIRLLGPLTAADTVLFPLLARQLPPGSHRLAVRAADALGHLTDSPAQSLVVLEHAPFMPGTYERAVFLLDRLAFGPEPRELAAVLTLGENAWLNNRLSASFDTLAEQASLRIACQKFPRIDDLHQATTRALNQWILSDNPVRSRFTAWTENHFSTWIEKTRAAPKWHEHLDFSRLGVAPFADLLSVSAHSPAMLGYLDQEKSYAAKLNENYAREIMELHTLGVHGGYKQADVTALAGVLNGWSTAAEAIPPQLDGPLRLVYNGNNESGVLRDFRFVPVLNDGKPRRVFGLQFPATPDATARYDNIRLAMEMLASHPSTAEHISRKLAEHYIGVPAPDALVASLSQTYLENGGDMRAVMRAMVAHPAFWNAPMKMATPFDFGLRIARVCRAAVVQIGGNPDQSPGADQIEGFLKKSGMGLFDRVTPDGYPENNSNYADSNALLQRWRFMQILGEPLNRLVPQNWRVPAATVTPAANETGPDHAAGPPPTENPLQRFIDLAAVRLTGHLLDGTSNQSALEVLGEGKPEQMRQTILFIALLPETSLR